MPVTAQLADGRTLEFPDGTDPQVIQATVKKMVSPTGADWLRANQDKRDTPEYTGVLESLQTDPARDEARRTQGVNGAEAYLMGSGPGRFVQGVADLPIGAAQLFANSGNATMKDPESGNSYALWSGQNLGQNYEAEPLAINQFVQDREQTMADAREAAGNHGEIFEGGIDGNRILGNLLFGAGATSGAKIAPTLGGKVLQGAGMGGAFGAATPVSSDNYGSTKLAQTAISAALGGALSGFIPPVMQAGKSVGGWIGGHMSPYLPGGGRRSGIQLANEMAGSRQPEIARLLQEGRNPLGRGTAGEIASPAGSAEFSALQKVAGMRNPSERVAGTVAANQARQQALRSIGGSADDLANAQAYRGGVGNADYSRAAQQPFAPTQEFTRLLDNPFIKSALSSVDDVANSQGIQKGTTEYYHLVKKSLDGILSTPAKQGGLDPFLRTAVSNVRRRFISELEKSNPLYKTARTRFASNSQPINQMQVGQQLENSLVPSVSDIGNSAARQRASTFATALREAPRTVKRATGDSIYQSLDDVLTPNQMQVVNNVSDDLARSANYETLANAGTQAAREGAQDVGSASAPKLLDRAFVLFNSAFSKLSNKATGNAIDYLDDIMRNNPQELGRLMAKASPEEESAILTVLGYMRNSPSIMAAGAENEK